MWTILVLTLAYVDGALRPDAQFETGLEFTSRSACEQVLHDPRLRINFPEEYDHEENGIVAVKLSCEPIGDLSTYM